uniref:ShKT domain-containing protein n=1 Tax=Rhabditophanes sp. KR3021 TaxID=114890 RepID=A0AC35UHC1_9BILA
MQFSIGSVILLICQIFSILSIEDNNFIVNEMDLLIDTKNNMNADTCKDVAANCPTLKRFCLSLNKNHFMETRCALTCDLCSKIVTTTSIIKVKIGGPKTTTTDNGKGTPKVEKNAPDSENTNNLTPKPVESAIEN